ncbi:hypothetical protein [Lysinibacillus sphaericus]|uniref:hypothetical protein n=1 Tax=Lysinibacillus sphaericus TaxID=1421 RepID=UPI003D0061C7
MTSSVNLWPTIPSLSTKLSLTNKNAATTSDFTAYLLHATAALNKTSSTSLYNLFGDMYGHSNTSTMKTPTMSDYLQNGFQTQQFKSLSMAQDKLQTQMTNFAATVHENSPLSVQQKLAKMKNNIALLNDYLAQQTDTAINTSTL